MKFCPKLLTEINFEPGALQPCCDIRDIKPPVFPYSGGPVDMNAYARHMENTIEDMQKEGGICAGCPEMREIPDGTTDASLLFHAVSVNMHRFYCNCRCVYCGLWQPREKEPYYDILPPLKSLQEQGVLAKNCLVSWGGGEPAILPTFDDASKWCADQGFSQYVHSNAIRFSPVMAALLRRNKMRLNISLDSASPEIYRAVKGVDAFAKVMGNLNRYAREGHPDNIDLKYIVFEANNEIGEIERFLTLCQKLGIRNVELSLNFLEVNKKAVSEKTILGAGYFVARARQLGLKNFMFIIDEPWKSRIEERAASFAA